MTRLAPTLVLLSLAAPALAGPPVVVVVEPAAGATIARRTFDVRVRIEAEGEVTAALVCAPRWRRDAPLTIPLQRRPDGRWGVDGVSTERAAGGRGRIVVRAGEREEALPLDIIDESGWAESSVLGPGSPLDPIAATDLAGQAVELAPAKDRPTLVLLYSAADDCEEELAFLRATRRRWPALTIIGVGSVAPEGVEAWRRWLAEREVDWPNVADTDGAIERAFYARRKALGNATEGPILYYVRDGAVRGGDYVEPSFLFDGGVLRVMCTTEALIQDLGPGD